MLNLLVTLTVLAAVVCSTWALWLRRSTWRYRYEAGPTANIALLLAALALCSPAAAKTIGRALHESTKVWHLDDYAGHCLYLIATAVILYHVLRRIAPDAHLRAMFVRYVWVIAAAMPTMLFLLLRSDAASAVFVANMFAIQPDTELMLYWTVFFGTTGYLLVVAGYALLVVRRDPRSRRAANLWATAGALGMVACVVGVVNAYTGASLPVAVWAFTGAATCVFAVSAATAWRSRLRPYRELLQATRHKASL